MFIALTLHYSYISVRNVDFNSTQLTAWLPALSLRRFQLSACSCFLFHASSSSRRADGRNLNPSPGRDHTVCLVAFSLRSQRRWPGVNRWTPRVGHCSAKILNAQSDFWIFSRRRWGCCRVNALLSLPPPSKPSSPRQVKLRHWQSNATLFMLMVHSRSGTRHDLTFVRMARGTDWETGAFPGWTANMALWI